MTEKISPSPAENMTAMLHYIKNHAPLIHCITNPISINDCANILLAVGARPIMAEHPREVAEIVSTAQALALNLGNITDVRMDSMLIAARKAGELGIPIVLDLVGINCSTLRREYAQTLINTQMPNIIKGNISEIRTLLGLPITPGTGIAAGEKETTTRQNVAAYAEQFKKKAREYHTALLATGPIDLVVNEDIFYALDKGTKALSAITGTGCMINVLTGACLAALHGLAASEQGLEETGTRPIPDDIEAGRMACFLMSLAGEKANDYYKAKGLGSFHTGLMDAMSQITPEELKINLDLL